MTTYDIVLPRLGEAVIEATLIRWLKQEGDPVGEEEPIAEIATDKVDTEIVSPVNGKLVRLMFAPGTVIPVGAVIAVLEIRESGKQKAPQEKKDSPLSLPPQAPPAATPEISNPPEPAGSHGSRFYSPLVRSIAKQEHISFRELDTISGSGKNDRLTRKDLLNYLESTKAKSGRKPPDLFRHGTPPMAGDEVVEMDRVRQLIASHMVHSVQTSPHVTSFVEADLSGVVKWREQSKDLFLKREGIRLTYTPVFIEAIARAVRDIPGINISVDGQKIILHRQINVGMAVALPNSNLIVPVVRDADRKSLLGITREVNDLAERARSNKLLPDDITGGTISLTNLGSFGTLMGTPIIPQPQAAIVAVGAITKRPVVIESPGGDTIGIRHRMFLSVTFDHRVVDGAMAGQFLTKLTGYLENFDTTQTL
jgi:2-oxoglutarate dehydrogenase E2 component (dihydrolipoamide succinyltransferase)